jgi:hypothetical protein
VAIIVPVFVVGGIGDLASPKSGRFVAAWGLARTTPRLALGLAWNWADVISI